MLQADAPEDEGAHDNVQQNGGQTNVGRQTRALEGRGSYGDG